MSSNTAHGLDATVASSASSSSSPPPASANAPPSPFPHLSIISFNMLAPPYKRCQANVVSAAPACYPLPVTPATAAACAAASAAPPPSGPILESGTTYSSSPPPSPFPTSRYRESSRPEEWRARISLIIAALKQTEADIICLEEYWTAGKEFCELMEDAFCKPSPNHSCPLYSLYTAPRTGGKDDGIAVLLRRASRKGQIDLTVARDWNFSLTGFGNRVGKLLQVEGRLLQEDTVVTSTHVQQPVLNRSHSSSHAVEFHSWSWKDQFHAQMHTHTTTANGTVAHHHQVHHHHAEPACVRFHFLLLVTHLTFPHGFFDSQQRKYEIGSLLQQLDNVRNSDTNASPSSLPLRSLPVVLTGDFNTCVADASLDYVYSYTVKRGFTSTFASVNSREPGATHFNHRKECVPVDFIFLRTAQSIAEEQKQNGSSTTGPAAGVKSNLAAAASVSHNPTCAVDLRPVYSSLLPLALPHTFWPSFSDFKLSDHRPLLTVFDVEGLPTFASVSTSTAASSTVVAIGDGEDNFSKPAGTSTSPGVAATTASQPAAIDGTNQHASAVLKPNANDRSQALTAAL